MFVRTYRASIGQSCGLGNGQRLAMKIVTGGQSGVDRAALDVALERNISYAGWCPRGGWAEDFPDPPGLLAKYPLLRETPLADPAQRTEWNVRDSDAVLIIADPAAQSASKGTELGRNLAQKFEKPILIVDVGDPNEIGRTADWINAQLARRGDSFTLGIGGPRESEAPGIYSKTLKFLNAALDRAQC
jgi:hypothetical protein